MLNFWNSIWTRKKSSSLDPIIVANCYVDLAFAMSGKCPNTENRKKYQDKGEKMSKLFTTDMKNGSVNAYPIVIMLEAEESPSKEKYDAANKASACLGLVHHEAYMCERSGDFFIERENKEWSEFYLVQAILLYGEWGATGKAEKLSGDNPEVVHQKIYK